MQGCDASVLIASTPDNVAERDAVPNLTVRGYDIVDEIKSQVEAMCPGIVSCADIIALAGRDAVVQVMDSCTERNFGTHQLQPFCAEESKPTKN